MAQYNVYVYSESVRSLVCSTIASMSFSAAHQLKPMLTLKNSVSHTVCQLHTAVITSLQRNLFKSHQESGKNTAVVCNV